MVSRWSTRPTGRTGEVNIWKHKMPVKDEHLLSGDRLMIGTRDRGILWWKGKKHVAVLEKGAPKLKFLKVVKGVKRFFDLNWDS